MTKAQAIYERVDALVTDGLSKGEAYRQVAEELGLKPNSVRGACYQHTRKLNGGGSRRRVRETTTDGAIASATAALEQALANIDEEIGHAKERADEAKAEYEALKASASDRKVAITAKIEALSA